MSTLFLQRLKAKSKGFKDHIFEANSFSFSHKFSQNSFFDTFETSKLVFSLMFFWGKTILILKSLPNSSGQNYTQRSFFTKDDLFSNF